MRSRLDLKNKLAKMLRTKPLKPINCTCKVCEYSSNPWRFSYDDEFCRDYHFFNEGVRSSRIIRNLLWQKHRKAYVNGKAIAIALRGYFLVEAVLEETFMRPFLMINTNASNTEVEGNAKVQTDRSNQTVTYNKIEIDEDAICGEQYDKFILGNKDASWAEKILNNLNNFKQHLDGD